MERVRVLEFGEPRGLVPWLAGLTGSSTFSVNLSKGTRESRWHSVLQPQVAPSAALPGVPCGRGRQPQ
jgi:hypothetical protein